MRTRSALAGLLLGMAACATPGQVRSVQTQVAVLDRDHVRADSARAADLAQIKASQQRMMDSLSLIWLRMDDAITRLSRTTAGEFTDIRRQMLALAEQIPQLASRLSQFRTDLEASRATTDSSGKGAGLSPEALSNQGFAALLQGANSTARATFQQLLRDNPNAPQVVDALFGIGKSFDPASPDSAAVYYTQVTKRFPDSPRTAQAFYRLGVGALNRGDRAAAKAYLTQVVVEKFKNTDEYGLAQGLLRDLP